ncbi:MAG TPA: potassium-transporting ATPase subunit KdpC [bacterium]|nr:potassium-transporting ATPase subunit KdpC [bacterium]
MFREHIRPMLVIFAILTVITGVLYPLAVTGVAHCFFRDQGNGSLVVRDGRAVGSRLIGQQFDDPKYFWGRLSATAPVPYNGASSAGSNLGPMNPAFIEAVKARIAALKAADPENTDPIPVDLVTASGSGLDPHISAAAARYQVGRVARARGVSPDIVTSLVQKHTAGRFLGIIGEPIVNVLGLNLELDGYKNTKTE